MKDDFKMTEEQKQAKAYILKELKKHTPNSKFSNVSEDLQKKSKRIYKNSIEPIRKII